MKANGVDETSARGHRVGISDAMPNRFNGCGNSGDFRRHLDNADTFANEAGDGVFETGDGERIRLGRLMTATVPRMTKNRLKGAQGRVKCAEMVRAGHEFGPMPWRGVAVYPVPATWPRLGHVVRRAVLGI